MVETLPAAIEMEEMLYELRDYACGMNAGRWDYIFSAIKRLQSKPDAVFPDRKQVNPLKVIFKTVKYLLLLFNFVLPHSRVKTIYPSCEDHAETKVKSISESASRAGGGFGFILIIFALFAVYFFDLERRISIACCCGISYEYDF